jgi:hypothetical protein
MPVAEFFNQYFAPEYWPGLDRSRLTTDDQSFFGSPDVFRWIIGAVRPELIIEVGSWKGHSANFMADVCREMGLNTRIICVDTFLGSAEHWAHAHLNPDLHIRNGRPTILERFQGNTLARGNQDKVFPLPLDSSSAWGVLHWHQIKADLIFIDAGHEYRSVAQDIRIYRDLRREGGVLFGDDYNWEETGRAVHDCAVELGETVVTAEWKWAYAAPALEPLPPMAQVQPVQYIWPKT